MSEMDDFLRALPKAELHVHLEGSIEPATLVEIEPSLSIEDAVARYRYQDFQGFLKSYEWVNRYLRTPADYACIMRRLLKRLESEGVIYAEINVSAGVILWKNQPLEAMFAAVVEEAARSPVRTRFIFDAVRQFGVEAAWAVARRAASLRTDGVVAFGLGGDEARGPAALFRDVCAFARDQGLHLSIHAGETGGPDSIRQALECGSERIGHGIAAAADPALLDLLRERDIPLEICISSNVSTGAVASLDEHPLRRIWDAGVPVVLNTDDPPMFHTTLIREYKLAALHFGFTRDELRKVAANSLRYAFADSPDSPGA